MRQLHTSVHPLGAVRRGKFTCARSHTQIRHTCALSRKKKKKHSHTPLTRRWQRILLTWTESLARTRALGSTDSPAYSAALAAAPHPVRATRHHGNPFNSPCSDITFAVALFYMSESVQPSIYFTGSEWETEREGCVSFSTYCIQTNAQQKHREHFQKSVCFTKHFQWITTT